MRAIQPDLTHDLRESAWLAGFIDGEGCFAVQVNAREGNAWPVLEISQRDDDLRLIEEIAVALGGCVKRKVVPQSKLDSPYNHSPQARVCVSGKASLLGVVAYLDHFELRTKKFTEYVVWREAVMAYVEDGGRAPVLVEVKMRLESLKGYVPPLAVVA